MSAPIVRTFHHGDFPVTALLGAKRGRTVSVCLPARDEAATIGPIVATILHELVERVAVVDEVLVLDDGSSDDTAAVARAAGARVVAVADVLPECGRGEGKGEALWKSVHAASGDLIVWCDADVRSFDHRFVTGLLGPLLLRDDVAFVKGFYARPLAGSAHGGGRVTELVARPLISLLFPSLVPIVQPLAGEYAVRREVVELLPFVQGYGVDLALLVDVALRFGLSSIAQVDLGVRVHRNRPLDQLGPQAMAVIQTALRRADIPVSLDSAAVLCTPGLEPVVVDHAERPPMVEVAAYREAQAARRSATTVVMQPTGSRVARSRPKRSTKEATSGSIVPPSV